MAMNLQMRYWAEMRDRQRILIFLASILSDILLKLNKLANSDRRVILGVKGEHDGFYNTKHGSISPRVRPDGQRNKIPDLTSHRRDDVDLHSGAAL